MKAFSIAKYNLAVNYSQTLSVTQILQGFDVCRTLIFYELLIYMRKGRIGPASSARSWCSK